MTADWKPIETAPKDREIMVTDGFNVEPAEWANIFGGLFEDNQVRCRGGWQTKGLEPEGINREMRFATHWDEMPQLPA